MPHRFVMAGRWTEFPGYGESPKYQAEHDLPAFIDLVLKVSKYDRLLYIGYSFGSTSFMVMASMMPQYAEKVIMAILLAPVGYELENGYFFVKNVAKDIVESVPEEVRKTLMDRTPSGGSSMDIIYLAQLYVHGFRAYDYGENINKEVYGQSVPPRVEVENIKTPVAIFYSVGDHLNDEAGILKLSKQLPNVVQLKKLENEKFGHLDFMIGKNAENGLYKEILQTIEDYDYF